MSSSARRVAVELNSNRLELETKLKKALQLYETSKNVAQAARDAGVSKKLVRGYILFSEKFSLLLFNFSC